MSSRINMRRARGPINIGRKRRRRKRSKISSKQNLLEPTTARRGGSRGRMLILSNDTGEHEGVSPT